MASQVKRRRIPLEEHVKNALHDDDQRRNKRRRREKPAQIAMKLIKEGSLEHEGSRLQVKFISPYKGHGVFAKKKIEKEDFIAEYRGERITVEEGDKRLSAPGIGSFLFFVGKKTCIDASHSDGVGRMINDSIKKKIANCNVKMINEHLCLFASRDISIDEEIVYFYGETEENMYWRLGKDPDCYFTPVKAISDDVPCHTVEAISDDVPCHTVEAISDDVPCHTVEAISDDDDVHVPCHTVEAISDDDVPCHTVKATSVPCHTVEAISDDDVPCHTVKAISDDVPCHTVEAISDDVPCHTVEAISDDVPCHTVKAISDDVPCHTVEAISDDDVPCHTVEAISDDVPCHTVEAISDDVPCHTVEAISDDVPCHTVEAISDDVPCHTVEAISDDVPCHTVKAISDDVPCHTVKAISDDVPCHTVEPLNDEERERENLAAFQRYYTTRESRYCGTSSSILVFSKKAAFEHTLLSYPDLILEDFVAEDFGWQVDTDDSHDIDCKESAGCVEKQAGNDLDCVTQQADIDPGCVTQQADIDPQADNDPGCVTQQADNDPGCVTEQADNEPQVDSNPGCVTEQADNDPQADSNPGCVTEQADIDPQADNYPGCVTEQADIDPQADSNPGCVTEQADNDPGCVTQQADIDPQVDNDPGCVTQQADNDPQADIDPGCVTEQIDNDHDNETEPVKEHDDGAALSGELFGTVVVIKNEMECDVFAMCSSVLALGSARSNDIIVKNAKLHEIVLQANRFGEVFLFHEHTQFSEGHYLQHDEVFQVGRRLFKWKYPLVLGKVDRADRVFDYVGETPDDVHFCIEQDADIRHKCVTEQADNDPGSVTVQADNDPGSVTVQADNDPGSVTVQADNDPGCVTEQADNDPSSVTVQADIDPGSVTEQADIEPGSVTEQADNDPVCVTEQADIDPGRVTEQADIDHGSVTEQADIDLGSVTEQADIDPGRVTEQADIDHGSVTEQADIDLGSVTEQADNDSGRVTEQADNFPGSVTEWADIDPGSVTEWADSDSDCVEEQDVSEIEDENSDTESINNDSVKDLDFSFEDSDEQYISEEDYVSGSDSNSVILPLVESLPKLRNKRSLDDDCSENVTKKKKSSVQCSIVTSTEIPERQNVDTDKLSDGSNNGNIKLQLSRNEKGRRVWDKLHYCVFCEESFTNITKHLFGVHKHENEVIQISNMDKKSKNRADSLLKLRNAGDYKHNMDVLKNGNGTLVTWSRKEGEEHGPTDYLPCEDCLAFFLKKSLWRHRKNCPFRKDKTVNRRVQSAASLLLPVSKKISEGLKENVIKKMIGDEVTMVVRNDSLILSVGEKLFQKHGHLEHLNTHISQKMRELGRLLIKARSMDPEIQYLTDMLVPAKFSNVTVAATRALCKYDESTNIYGNPSLAMKLGHLLKKCARIKKSASLIVGDSEVGKHADDFLHLVENEWTDEVSSCALQTLKANKMNKAQILPLTEDIMKLQAYLKTLRNTNVATLEKKFSKLAYDTLNQVTLACLILFNRRRGGETERLKLEAYSTKCNKVCTPKEVEDSFSPVEKVLCTTFSRLEIRGKKGRPVPVLITPEVESSINLLLKHRESAGIHEANPYLFPRSNFKSKRPIRCTDVIRKFAMKANLSRPEDITSTNLRKHVATISQVLNLSRHDMETMAGFMGHDIDIHRAFYRLPQETIQVVKMGRLLSAFDKGTIGQYSGKTLDEIPVEMDMEIGSNDDPDRETSDDGKETEDVEITLDIQPCSSRVCRRLNVSEDRDDEEQESTVEETEKRTQPVREKTKRGVQRLTEDQAKLLKTLFKTNVQLRRELRRLECEKVLNKYSILGNLDWKKVKNTIHNWITQEKRKLKQIM